MQEARRRAIVEVEKWWWDLDDILRVILHKAAECATSPDDLAVHILRDTRPGGRESIYQSFMDLAVLLAGIVPRGVRLPRRILPRLGV